METARESQERCWSALTRSKIFCVNCSRTFLQNRTARKPHTLAPPPPSGEALKVQSAGLHQSPAWKWWHSQATWRHRRSGSSPELLKVPHLFLKQEMFCSIFKHYSSCSSPICPPGGGVWSISWSCSPAGQVRREHWCESLHGLGSTLLSVWEMTWVLLPWSPASNNRGQHHRGNNTRRQVFADSSENGIS